MSSISQEWRPEYDNSPGNPSAPLAPWRAALHIPGSRLFLEGVAFYTEAGCRSFIRSHVQGKTESLAEESP